MSIHLQREITHLKEIMLSVATKVEENFARAIKALKENDEELALKSIKMDNEIDKMELQVEEECLKILALHQPVAIDLRFIVAVLKINNDLERIGDLASNIAARAHFFMRTKPIFINEEIYIMADSVKLMLKNSLDALINLDIELAKQVSIDDQKVDDLHLEMYSLAKKAILKNPNPQYIDAQSRLLNISRSLERIADLSTNIAEDVIYMVNGEIIRHKHLSN